jgi:hypothetical protein
MVDEENLIQGDIAQVAAQSAPLRRVGVVPTLTVRLQDLAVTFSDCITMYDTNPQLVTFE